MITRGDTGETEQHQQFRTYYDAWVVRNVGGPGRPGEWVKLLRDELFASEVEAIQFGKDMTADAQYTPDRPAGFYVVFEVVDRAVIRGREVPRDS